MVSGHVEQARGGSNVTSNGADIQSQYHHDNYSCFALDQADHYGK